MKTIKKEFPLQKQENLVSVSSDYGIPTPAPFNELIEAFSVHTWVYACANLIANAFSMIDFVTYKETPTGKWEENTVHPFYKLLKNPNPYMSAMEVKRLLSLSSKLTGNAFAILEPSKGTPLELWPLQPDKVTVKSDSVKFISGYVYTVNGMVQDLNPERIIHVREGTPTNLQYGQGSLQAVKNTVATDIFAEEWNRNFFSNSARPDAILETENAMPLPMQKQAIENFKKSHQGTSKTARTALLSGGLKYKEVNRTHKDMDFIALRKMLREEVLASFGVPQSMVGILDQANYSNMKEQTKIFWTQTMIPEIRKFESVMTMRARQITGDDKTVIQADLSKVEALRADEQSRATIAQTYFNMGIPMEKIVEALDLPFEGLTDATLRKPTMPEPMPQDPALQEDQQDAQEPPKTATGKAIKSFGGVDRVAMWKRWENGILPFENALEKTMKAYFKSQHGRVMKAFEANAEKIVPKNEKAMKQEDEVMGLVFDPKREAVIMGRAVDPKLRATYKAGAVATAGSINGAKKAVGTSFDMDETKAGDWIARKKLKLVKEVTDYTQEQLTDDIVESVKEATATGLSQSETIAQIKDRIDETYKFANEKRSGTIARTEVVSANNAGSYQAMEELGVKEKQWLSVPNDGRNRDAHLQMDGKTVPLNEPFELPDGDTIMYPGSPDGSAGNVINCRCTPMAVLK